MKITLDTFTEGIDQTRCVDKIEIDFHPDANYEDWRSVLGTILSAASFSPEQVREILGSPPQTWVVPEGCLPQPLMKPDTSSEGPF